MKPRDLVARSVKRLREEREWKQDELAERIDPYVEYEWSRQTVSDAERGRRAFTADDLVALAWVFEVPVSILFQPESSTEKLELPSGKRVPATEVATPMNFGGLLPGEDLKLLDSMFTRAFAAWDRTSDHLEDLNQQLELIRGVVVQPRKREGKKR